ncbi:MAG: LCP family protein, partial [Clostridia bacterium]|nr:LCP family protein [Clostridia bacterium]
MNIKRFFAVFFISTALLFCCLFVAAYIYVSGLQVGEVIDIAELDTHVEQNERKNVLVIGTDKSGVLADVIMIFSFSDEKDPVNMVSIQRDTDVMVDGRSWKINSTYQLGLERFVGIIKDVAGVQIHDYIVVNFKA